MHPREGWTEDRRAGGLSRRGFLKQGAGRRAADRWGRLAPGRLQFRRHHDAGVHPPPPAGSRFPGRTIR